MSKEQIYSLVHLGLMLLILITMAIINNINIKEFINSSEIREMRLERRIQEYQEEIKELEAKLDKEYQDQDNTIGHFTTEALLEELKRRIGEDDE